MKLIKYSILIGILIFLSSCGFKLRSKADLPPQMQTMNLQSANPYASLELALKNSLQATGANIVKSAPITLNIINTSLTHSNPDISSSSQATVYTFTYTVTFDLLDKIGKAIISPQTVTATRNLTLSPNTVLEASGEVDIIKQEMERELVLKILSRINAKNTRAALKN